MIAKIIGAKPACGHGPCSLLTTTRFVLGPVGYTIGLTRIQGRRKRFTLDNSSLDTGVTPARTYYRKLSREWCGLPGLVRAFLRHIKVSLLVRGFIRLGKAKYFQPVAGSMNHSPVSEPNRLSVNPLCRFIIILFLHVITSSRSLKVPYYMLANLDSDSLFVTQFHISPALMFSSVI